MLATDKILHPMDPRHSVEEHNGTYAAGISSLEKPQPNVLLYIDNSNIFESTKKYSGHRKGYKSGIADVACRIDVGKLTRRALGNRELLIGRLYGSEPPALDTVWEAIRRQKIDVQTFKRSTWTQKEKETDTTLTGDAVEDIMEQKHNAGINRTVILFSGDRDLLTVVKKAIKHEYRVEIWSFRSYMNNNCKRIAHENKDKVFINYIDNIFDEVTFTTFVWAQNQFPAERSLVATVSVPDNLEKKKYLQTFVATAGEVFKLPMMGKFMHDYKFIVIFPAVQEHYNVPQPSKENGHTLNEVQHARRYDFNRHVFPFKHQLQERFAVNCSDITTWIEFRQSGNIPEDESFTSPNRFELLQDDDIDSEIDEAEDIEFDLYYYDAFEVCLEVNDVQDIIDHDYEYEESSKDGDFICAVRKSVNKNQMYSDPCKFQFACSHQKCFYKHTPEEKEFFKIQPDPKRRFLYKTKFCYHHEKCKYRSKSYLCPYAHNLEESRCVACKKHGLHWMDQCPYLKR